MFVYARLFLYLILSCSLLACGTTPTPISDAKAVPSSRVHRALTTISSNPAKLVVIRDVGLQGIEHVFELWINGIFLVEMKAGESYTLPIDPGSIFIETRMFNVLGTVSPVQVETVLVGGNSYFYRAGIDGQLKLHLLRDHTLSNKASVSK